MGKRCALSRPYAGRGSVRAATAGTVAPSPLLLKFGKLTTKFELLCKETKTLLFQNFGRETSGAGDVRAVCGVLSAPSKKQGCLWQPCSLS